MRNSRESIVPVTTELQILENAPGIGCDARHTDMESDRERPEIKLQTALHGCDELKTVTERGEWWKALGSKNVDGHSARPPDRYFLGWVSDLSGFGAGICPCSLVGGTMPFILM